MKVTLISHTPDALDLLIFTKGTRLALSPNRMDVVRRMPMEDKLHEADYISKTIPSSWEFVDLVFLVEGVSRACTHQMVRTRNASYAQQSLRVVENSEYEYVYTDRNKTKSNVMEVIAEVNRVIKEAYRTLVEDYDHPVEDSRGILPTNIGTNIVCKYNLRTLSELARSRTGGRTQSEYVKIVTAMVDATLEALPWAGPFLSIQSRDLFAEIEAFAEKEFGGDLLRKGKLLKIVDELRKKMK
jgi:flavin-dependent thymidylate synthase